MAIARAVKPPRVMRCKESVGEKAKIVEIRGRKMSVWIRILKIEEVDCGCFDFFQNLWGELVIESFLKFV